MCGIVGFLGPAQPSDLLTSLVGAMTGTLRHRGPDDHGCWADPVAGIALGHTRLSILDLSPEGHQPMVSASGRYVVSFNGEIYNFQEIRRTLEMKGHRFRGTSDTEVLLAAVEQWGIQRAVQRFAGMFAFALWDLQLKQLTLGRDRVGIKPLYYGWGKDTFFFGSELKAFVAHPSFVPEVDRDSLVSLLRFGYVPTPRSIFKKANKLPPGTCLTVTSPLENAAPVRYWDARAIAESGAHAEPLPRYPELVQDLDSLLRAVVRQHMVSDVPLGAFLSGGIDSSTVVALMQSQSTRPIKTFSIGFREQGFDEAQHARSVADHLGTDHTELYLTPKECTDLLPSMPTLYDEPFADSSQIPTFLVSQLARRSVTVSLSGDGGDELFCGYDRYAHAHRLVNHPLRPGGMKRGVGRALTMGPMGLLGPCYDLVGAALPGRWRRNGLAAHLENLSHWRPPLPEATYRGMMSLWNEPEDLVLDGREPLTRISDLAAWPILQDFRERLMVMDLVTYLPDDILTKVDRASMGVSLEARVPLLDHRVVEFALRLPLMYKVRDGQTKWLLRQVLYRYVPQSLVDRPKMGFGVPIGSWLRGPLKEWADSLITEDRLIREGFLRQGRVRQAWREHLLGERDWGSHLWPILMFQAWLESVKHPERPAQQSERVMTQG